MSQATSSAQQELLPSTRNSPTASLSWWSMSGPWCQAKLWWTLAALLMNSDYKL